VVTGFLRGAWVRLLLLGAILWIALTWATVSTGNIGLVPSVIALGAFLGPLTFVVYERVRDVPVVTMLTCFVVGGALGVAAAGVLEYRTLIELHALPTLAIGLIEESCKLIVPLGAFVLRRFRREVDGLFVGVASGRCLPDRGRPACPLGRGEHIDPADRGRGRQPRASGLAPSRRSGRAAVGFENRVSRSCGGPTASSPATVARG
jgi:hypothetical protein